MKIIQIILIFVSTIWANTSNNIAIVYITDDTLQKYGSFPLSRDVYAKFIDKLYENYSPKVVSINLTIDLPNKSDIEGDVQLFKSTKDKKNLIFSGLLSNSILDHTKYEQQQVQPSRINTEIRERKGAFLPLSPLIKNGGYFGILNASVDTNGYIISFPFVYNINKKYYTSILFKIISLYKNIPLKQFILNKQTFKSENLNIDNLYFGELIPKLTYNFNTYTYDDILENKVNKEYINGKIILFDINATGVESTFPVKDNLQMNSSLYLANVIETALQNEAVDDDTNLFLFLGSVLMLIVLISFYIYTRAKLLN